MKLAIILPAYNEEITIAETIIMFNSILPNASIWIINNRSSDSTELISRNTLLSLKCNGGVINELRKGKGNAIRRAFMEIDADLYVLADADMTYPAEQTPELIKPVQDGSFDMVVGNRHSDGVYDAQNKRLMHGFGNNLVKNLVNKLFNADLRDIMSGFRVLSRRFVKSYPILVEGFEIETDMTLHALDKRYRILEIPIKYRNRPLGSFSKLNTYRDGLKVILSIINILRYYRPLFFFFSLSILTSFIGLITGLPVIIEWISLNYITHIPLAILATGLEVIAFIFASIGIILDSIVKQEKRNFERDMLKY